MWSLLEVCGVNSVKLSWVLGNLKKKQGCYCYSLLSRLEQKFCETFLYRILTTCRFYVSGACQYILFLLYLAFFLWLFFLFLENALFYSVMLCMSHSWLYSISLPADSYHRALGGSMCQWLDWPLVFLFLASVKVTCLVHDFFRWILQPVWKRQGFYDFFGPFLHLRGIYFWVHFLGAKMVSLVVL